MGDAQELGEGGNAAGVGARLAVIESRLQDILGHLLEIRSYVPDRVVQQEERLATLEKAQRSMIWGVALTAGALLSAFVGHVFGR